MTFQPVLPLGGYAGWVFLNRTLEAQQQAHVQSSQSDTDYFTEHIGEVRTADDLVSDRRLLAVALGAFGLDDDIGNTFFIRKILEEGTSNPSALANKLADKTYRSFSSAFGFGEGALPRTVLSGFAEEITSSYQRSQFEVAVGEQNDDFRLALNVQRDLPEIVNGSMSEDARWYSIMGSPPLRAVFETALGLPDSFAAIDIDDQLETFKEKTRSQFGFDSVAAFSDPEALDKLVQTFLLRSELEAGSGSLTAANTALILLGGG